MQNFTYLGKISIHDSTSTDLPSTNLSIQIPQPTRNPFDSSTICCGHTTYSSRPFSPLSPQKQTSKVQLSEETTLKDSSEVNYMYISLIYFSSQLYISLHNYVFLFTIIYFSTQLYISLYHICFFQHFYLTITFVFLFTMVYVI